MPKQAEGKRDGAINPQNYNYNKQIETIDIINMVCVYMLCYKMSNNLLWDMIGRPFLTFKLQILILG